LIAAALVVSFRTNAGTPQAILIVSTLPWRRLFSDVRVADCGRTDR
jgi:hypothetical protein